MVDEGSEGRVGLLRGIILPVLAMMPYGERLKKLGLEFLFGCWSYVSAGVIQEVLKKRTTLFPDTLRGKVANWTEEVWRNILGRDFIEEVDGLHWDNIKRAVVDGEKIDPKSLFKDKKMGTNGFRVQDYLDPFRRVLVEALMGLFQPERTTYITVGGAVFVEQMLAGKQVNWSAIFLKHTHGMVKNLQKGKTVYLAPFLVHVYRSHGWLTKVEAAEFTEDLPFDFDEFESKAPKVPKSKAEET